jgi:hypothetical protein
MDNPLPQSGFAAHAGRIHLARAVSNTNPRDLADAMAEVWVSKLGKAQALAYARALVDMIEAHCAK